MAKKTNDSNTPKVDLRRVPQAERPAPTTGQHGSKLTLKWHDLNAGEQKIATALVALEPKTAVDVEGIAKAAFRNGGSEGKLKVRNGLRRLVRAGWVVKTDRATYRATADGRTRQAKGLSEPPPDKSTKAKTKKPKAKDTKDTKAAAEAKTPFTTRKPKTSQKKAPAVENHYADYEAEAKTVYPNAEGDELKTAVVCAAARKVGLSDTKIARETGITRGFIIPRVKRLKAASISLAETALDGLVVLATGSSNHAPNPTPAF